ncbi:hypothetical protein LIER_13553 [Lithospermum erythrorhizon]|uniref:CCHC-type domain-containing protein n=1 Tax=Lithospermum erythrorhizon TaxID=34254 RepID=A0AAV3PZ29_LITER
MFSMDGPNLWDKSSDMHLQPPPYVKLASGPKKSRKKDISEIKKTGRNEKLRKWVIFHCGWCGGTGHNKRSCQSRKSGKESVKPAIKKKKQQTKPQPPSTENEIEQQPPSTENKLEQQPPTTENEPEPPINASRRIRKNVDNDDDYQIVRVVQSPDGVPAVSQREQRRSKRALVKLEQRRAKKRKEEA